ncbi:MAG: dienelactone hydrolase family protein [Acidimicrobiia bacterium]|nr:dienelactone hydrolase family protein [Acidimicrobiia bacterium]
MRTFETVELSIVALAVLVPVMFGTRLKRGWMSLTLIGALVVQGLVEGFRWQLIPLHLATVGLAVGDLIWEDRRVRGIRRFRRAVLGIPGVAVLVVLPVALPIPDLPAPTGAFEVGTMTFVITDPEREEIYGLPEPDPDATTQPTIDEADEVETPAELRNIVVQAWYPTNASDGIEPVVWNPDLDVVGPALSRRFGYPGFMLNHVRDVRSSAFEGAEPLDGRIPVVLYSHGWGGFRTVAVDQMESIASHGYLVLAADHTYGSVAVRFPDSGDVVYLDERALPDEETTDPDDYEDASEELVETFADDLILILDQLALGPEGALADIADAADLERIGLYGHSAGGGAAARVCLIDERCDAVAGLDAWVEPIPDRFVARELQIPSMFIRSDEWRERPNDRRLRGMSERSPAVSYWIGLEGAGHFDFALPPSFSPFADTLGLKGPIPSDRVITILDDYLNAFFDRHLLGVGGALLDEPPPPELAIEVFE